MASFSEPPLAYTTPPFPSLYWPFNTKPSQSKYLYSLTDIWRFTLYWTLITILTAHFLTALWAVLMQFVSAWQKKRYLDSPVGRSLSAKNRKLLGENPIRETLVWVWFIPAIYLFLGGLLALTAGSITGVILGAVYNAGYFRMSVWTPLIWGIINMLVLILAGFRIQGGM